jgi:DNA-binding MarR family transcriptional regulator
VGKARAGRTVAAEELAELVPRLYRLLRTALDEEPGSPSLEQLRVMHRIDEGMHHVSTLAVARQMRMSAITAVLDVLVEHGWVERTPDPGDRRRTHVDLTPEGKAALRRGRRLTTRRMTAILATYGGDAEALGDALRGLASAVSDYDAERVRRPGGAAPPD